tara:strand:- start:70 stop:735 length:666 start_codon:yes stop_codon:yes gene_type:complete
VLKKVSVTLRPKRWRFRGASRRQTWDHVARYAMKRLEDRIVNQGRDGTGKRIPPLAPGAHFASVHDGRFQGGEKFRWITVNGKRELVRLHGSYAQAKVRAGARPKRDGKFTGAMWESLTPQVKATKRGIDLRLFFAGTDKRQKVKTGKLTKTGKVARRSFRNRDKALYMQYAGKGVGGGKVSGGGAVVTGGSKRLFRLMTFTPEEVAEMRDIVLANIRLRG